jgi:SAM-dependent methyltransferase
MPHEPGTAEVSDGDCLARLASGYRPPLRQWRRTYMRRRRRLLEAAINCNQLVESIQRGERLPSGLGYGFDERVIEYPWLLAAEPTGKALDAGSILNHSFLLPKFLPGLDSLMISTLAPEPESFPELGVSYHYGDMRELPFADGWFDTVFSLSTLEHVGMDNTFYGDDADQVPDPQVETKLALAELRRVTKPGGRILISVPYGKRIDMGWSRQLDEADVDDLVESLKPKEAKVEIYAYGSDGWNLSDAAGAAEAVYHDFTKEARWPEDKAAAARAIACVSVRV